VRATVAPEQRTITLTASGPATFPVTGLCTDTSEVYGGQCITRLSIGAGESITYPLR
jgi:hypothetical protein